jgi:NitT/TauT family transport system substrate-binding protein
MNTNDRPTTGRYGRRHFWAGMSALSAAAILHSRPAAAEPPPETTTVRFSEIPAACLAPQYVAEELLRADGFTDVQFVKFPTPEGSKPADFWMNDAPSHVMAVEGGGPVVALAGLHAGCYELFGTNQVRSIRDLKGKTVAVPGLSGRRVFVAALAASVGLDPVKDITWVVRPEGEAMRLFAEGKVDAFMGFPPEPQELRAKKVGRVLVNTLTDRPWSQYFCCMLITSREFVDASPVATKRVLRAVLKAADICAQEPERVARLAVERGLAQHYDSALQLIKELGYRQWRQYDPEETIRFYALRLREVNFVKSGPQKIITQGTDWRFLRELKKELRA